MLLAGLEENTYGLDPASTEFNVVCLGLLAPFTGWNQPVRVLVFLVHQVE